MSQYIKILSFFVACLLSTIIINSQLNYYTPQIIALVAIIIITLSLINKKLFLSPLIYLIQIVVFTTGGIHSPLLFLEYFLLFSLAFFETPKLILIYSLILSIFISQSLVNSTSLLYLFSFIFIAPLAYFVTQNNQDNKKLSYDREETLLWLTLDLKQKLQKLLPSKKIQKIINHTNELISELEKND
ncbi:MAG: hypothetical protein WC069_00050 [Candidatus Shapirobacteria bacterium]